MMCAHYFACLWYYVGMFGYKRDMPAWVDVIWDDGHGDSSIMIHYTYAFYWAIVTLFTTGYGDITACNPIEQWFSVFGILFGSILFAYFIGVMTTGLAQDLMSVTKRDFLEKSQAFCHDH